MSKRIANFCIGFTFILIMFSIIGIIVYIEIFFDYLSLECKIIFGTVFVAIFAGMANVVFEDWK